MKRKIIIQSICLILPFMMINQAEACRFWAATSPQIPEEFLVNQLIESPKSLKNLGNEYQDGWSVGFYKVDGEVVLRGEEPSHEDEQFDYAVKDVGKENPQIAFAHLRRASSGCVEGIDNPHPFKRVKNGRTWLFGHNGGVDKKLLIGLIGEEYLNANLPKVCTFDPPDSWIDSELLFLYLLKTIEQNKWYVEGGLHLAIMELYKHIEPEDRYLNFFLSDGETVWAFRSGLSLHFKYDEKRRISVVSSTVPDDNQKWTEVLNDTLLILYPFKEIETYSIYFDGWYGTDL